MAQSGAHYGLRARNFVGRRARKDVLSAEELQQPAAKATIGAGLRPGALTKAERLRFSSRSKAYLEARSAILERWEDDVQQYLTLEACLVGCEEGQQPMVEEAYMFLSEQGCINVGIPSGEPQSDSSSMTDEELHYHLVALLQKVDLDEWTEKRIRKELEQQLSVNLSERKAFIREKVMAFLQGERTAKPIKKSSRKSKGKVIVVGAGPAGLAAGLHLKRQGIEVVILEARERVGGRVHTYQGSGLSSAVDLGASIITGTAIDAEKGLRPDPSAIIARQLGLELLPLDKELPLFDGVSGEQVGRQQDHRIEQLRDALMDAARSRVEELGEDEVAGESFGEALEKALADLAANKVGPSGNGNGSESGAANLAMHIPKAQVAASVNPSASPNGAMPELQLDGHSGPPAEAEVPDATVEGAIATEPPSKQTDPDPPGERWGGSATMLGAGDESARLTGEGLLAEHKDITGNLQQDGTQSTPNGGECMQTDPGHEQPTPPLAANGDGEEEGLDSAAAARIVQTMSDADRRLLDWHWANLEYGCSARLSDVSLAHWNQDEEFGGFGGPHCMLRGGYSQITEAMAARLDVRMGQPVTSISAGEQSVKVQVASGEVFTGQAVIVTVPLGCLKAEQIAFQPPLPPWKVDAVQKLGFGTLNKVVLEFPSRFWDDSLSYFGAALPGGASSRGAASMFWNLTPITGANQLMALVSGEAAYDGESASQAQLQEIALKVLRTLHGADSVPEPNAVTVTRWMTEMYSKGSYSYVAIGATAETYDLLAKPVHRRILFAGEHTCKEHPDTVGGAMLTGLREAVRAHHMLKGDKDEVGAAAAAAVDTTTAKKRAQDSEGEGGATEQHRGKAADGRHKRRRRNETDSGDEAVIGGASSESFGQRAAAKTAEQIMQEMEQREVSREEVKAILRAVMMLSAGRNDAILRLLDAASDLDSRAKLLTHLLRAEASGLAAIAKDAECMQTFNAWLTDLIPNKPAFHVLQLLLKVLLAMPVDMEMLKTAGVARAVRSQLVEHPMKPIRTAAEQLVAKWVASSLGTTINAEKPAAVSSPGPQPKNLPPPALDPAFDPEYEQEMELLRQEKEEAARLAKEYEEHAKAIKDQLELESAGMQLPSIDDFDSYAKQHSSKRSSQNREAKLARRRERAQKALAAAEGQNSGAPMAHKERKPHANGKPPPSGGGSSKVTEEVAELVKSILKPLFGAGKLSKEDYKSIAKSAVTKVTSSRPPSAPKELSDKEKAKIKDLVGKYVQRCKGVSKA